MLEDDDGPRPDPDYPHKVKLALKAIEDAFGRLPIPKTDEVVGAARNNLDATELATAFGGKHWRELQIPELFFHREALSILGPAGFRFYLPAYMVASLKLTEHRADVCEYTLLSLRPPYTSSGPDESLRHFTATRIAALDEPQKEAVRAFLRALRADVGGWRTDPAMTEWGVDQT